MAINFDKLRSKLATQAEEAVKGLAAFGEQRAKEYCPVGKTGKLQGSIKSEPNGLEAKVAPHVFYAAYVEYGTTHRRKDGSTYEIKPQPYMRPAYQDVCEDGMKIVSEELKKAF